MEIRDPIHGSMDVSESEVVVLDVPGYQRLRSIKQLGFAEFSFPGATHNRYLHSLGACHLAGKAFDTIFKNYPFSTTSARQRLRQVVRLAALLHDIGHGPLSHSTEEVMPLLSELNVKVYQYRKSPRQRSLIEDVPQKANHEDFTIKYITDSHLTQILEDYFPDLLPIHVACLIDNTLACPDDFFIDRQLDFRSILSQIVSSELDVDRMDYLERDAYFCGTNYGKVELGWLISNLTYHQVENKLHLALNRRALYTFEDFLLARHHMYLMVYFHHKSVIFEEMLHRYLLSPDCQFRLPADIEAYTQCTDSALHEHLAAVDNIWAKAIALRRPYRVLFELHSARDTRRIEKIKKSLENEGIDVIYSSSKTRLSKYHTTSEKLEGLEIYLVDQYDRLAKPSLIVEGAEIFNKYEDTRGIERLYVSQENYLIAEDILVSRKL